MKTKLFLTIVSAFIGFTANSQCHYIPSTSTATDTLSYSFSGGSFQSFGCAPIDPTYWLSGNGNSVTVTFVNPESYPSFRVWGVNNDDTASVDINSVSYPLNASSASYDTKVVCGSSPGPNGIIFSGGKLTGPSLANYSYQNVQLNATNVTTITVNGLSGAGWGFAGVSVNCPLTGIGSLNTNRHQFTIFPNPLSIETTLQTDNLLRNATLTVDNCFGQTVKQIKNISGQTVVLSRDNLPSGLYFVRLTENNKTLAVDKLVITDK